MHHDRDDDDPPPPRDEGAVLRGILALGLASTTCALAAGGAGAAMGVPPVTACAIAIAGVVGLAIGLVIIAALWARGDGRGD